MIDMIYVIDVIHMSDVIDEIDMIDVIDVIDMIALIDNKIYICIDGWDSCFVGCKSKCGSGWLQLVGHQRHELGMRVYIGEYI